jgi:hypothetical protein
VVRATLPRPLGLWVAYAAAFLVTCPIAVLRTTGLAWPKAIAIGVAGFVVFQGFEFVFIR